MNQNRLVDMLEERNKVHDGRCGRNKTMHHGTEVKNIDK